MDVFRFFTVHSAQDQPNLVYGLVVLLHSQLSNGAAVVIQPSFSPDGFVEDIHK